MRSFRKFHLFPAFLAVCLSICWANVVWSQDKPAEEPFWGVGRPKGDATANMAPVPSFPIPTAADKLPISKMKLPPGFKVEVYASDILDARSMREGDNGTVFVSSLFVAGKLTPLPTKAVSVKSKPWPKNSSCPVVLNTTKVICTWRRPKTSRCLKTLKRTWAISGKVKSFTTSYQERCRTAGSSSKWGRTTNSMCRLAPIAIFAISNPNLPPSTA